MTFSSQLQQTEQTLTLKSDYFLSEVSYEILWLQTHSSSTGPSAGAQANQKSDNPTNASLVPQQSKHHFSPTLIQMQTAQKSLLLI